MQKVFKKIINELESASWWTPSTFDEDGYGNDDSEEVIRTDSAIEIINQAANDINGKYVSVETLKQVMWERDIAVEQLRQLGYGFGEKVGWIPCSERLPKYTDDYNVTVRVGNPLGNYETVMTFRFELIGNREPKWIMPNDNNIYTVIAWQPLPKRYKENEDD